MTIRELKSIEEFYMCEEMQKRIWGMEDREIVPSDLMVIYSKFGGMVLGAFDENKNMIGFLIAFPAFMGNKLYLHSHMLGVLAEKRFKGIGFKIKLKQREIAIKRGYDLVAWTFDPLQGVNANFNLRKLGVVISTYYRNFYGMMRNVLNYGLESDRFLAEWWVKSNRVLKRISGKYTLKKLSEITSEAGIVNETNVDENGFRVIKKLNLDLNNNVLLVEIPEDINKIKSVKMSLAIDWRIKTRRIFEEYFKKGYIITDFISERYKNMRRNFYVLKKCRKEDILDN